ncbi:restriction endonuclease subunit S [Lentilactobacillus parabuchneri]|uniref:restriction endonuclease subunit S n=1 Tax=Lentilactobacillus parabuchneri TaxID=152331 RepID=UPI0022363102|nr:restriction endonuclease subunit S [Lentilactobacillus parabuchneri]MCW4398943.1 restriction endonuclease subunit S [Lentilactobacillus parabuchneri]
MKDKQAKYPQLRFKGFTDPWVQRKLGDVVQKVKSYSLSRDVETEENTGFEYIHYGDIHTQKADVIDSDTQLPSIVAGNYDLVQAGDVIVADASEDYLGIAEPAVVVNTPTENLVAGLHTIALRPNGIDPVFLYYLLHTQSFKHFGFRTGTGLKVFGISYPNLAKFTFSMPTLKEQESIAKTLREMDNLIATNQRKLDLLKEQKKGYLQKMFPKNGAKVPELRFAEFANDWGQRKLGELGKIYTGNTPKTSDLDNWTDNKEGHIWITPTDIDKLIMSDSDRHLSEQGWSKARKIPENSVLITSIASIGKNTINAVPVAFNQQINAIVPEKNDSYFILSAMIKDTARFASVAGQTATAIINKTTFEKFQIATPSYEEQQKIGSFFKQLDNTITLHQCKLDLLKEQKKGFLQNMFV